MTSDPPVTASEDQVRDATRRTRLATLVAAAVAVLIAIMVLAQVPWDTTIRYERVSRSFDMPLLVLALVPAVFGVFALTTRKPQTKPVPVKELRAAAWVIPIFLLLCLFGQAWFAYEFFEAAA